MLEATLRARLQSLFSASALEQAGMEGRFLERQRQPEELHALSSALGHACHTQFASIAALANGSPGGPGIARDLLAGDPLMRQFYLQSDFIAHAWRKPGCYPADAVLTEKICGAPDQGHTPYAAALNQFFLARPMTAGVRAAIRGIERIIGGLPRGARVFSSGCGPGIEFQRLEKAGRLAVTAHLADYDLSALAIATGAIRGRRAVFARCNPFDLIKGATVFEQAVRGAHLSLEADGFNLEPASYDLVYSLNQLNAMETASSGPASGAARFAARLFTLVKPGGMLILGNCLAPGVSLTRQADQFILNALMDSRLACRTPEEMLALAAGLPEKPAAAAVLDESILNPAGLETAIGHLVIERQA